MHHVTFAVAILLAAGFLTAKLGQRLRLPSVTGYVCAGLILGPAGLNLVTHETLGDRLDHFTQIALMLIAFGIGEHLEWQRLRPVARNVALIGLGETLCAYVLVTTGTYLVAHLSHVGSADWQPRDFMALALLLGAISVATAPATTLHVMRELSAAGPLTSTLMAVVAVDNGLAIAFFGITVSAAHIIAGGANGSFVTALLSALNETVGSLFLGVLTGLAIDMIVHRLKKIEEMLTVGLALLLLCGELARLGHFSSLLAGMATGFTIVNRDRRDVRVFRAVNAFEPPIYVLFFTLAGTHINLSTVAATGWVGLAYFALRPLGKISGARVGSRLAAAAVAVQKHLGLALIPQAGVAIGLVLLLQSDPSLSVYSSVITPAVLAGVVLSELVGPICARMAVTRAGEALSEAHGPLRARPAQSTNGTVKPGNAVQLVPWTWERLAPPPRPHGVVLFGAANPRVVTGLARIATLLAHAYGAQPLELHVVEGRAQCNSSDVGQDTLRLFEMSKREARTLSDLRLLTEVVRAETVTAGILETARKRKSWAIVLGHPVGGTAKSFQRVVEGVAKEAPCPVIVARFVGLLHTERILVPVIDDSELSIVSSVVRSLAVVGPHTVTILRLMASGSASTELEICRQNLDNWAEQENLRALVHCEVTGSDARVDTIVQAARQHDLLIMAATASKGLSRFFFGSLAEDVAQRAGRSMLLVHGRGQ